MPLPSIGEGVDAIIIFVIWVLAWNDGVVNIITDVGFFVTGN